MNDDQKVCLVCGATEDECIIKKYKGNYLCSKHRAQMYRHGKIVDETKTTTQSKNEIIIYDNYAELIVRNKTNTIIYKVKIDLDDVEKISKHKWRYETSKVKKKGYIVSGGPSKKRLKLHRFVLNYDGNLEVDHINRDTLDNRKENLRVVKQVLNAQNIDTKKQNIEQMSSGKWRVRIIRFKREFLFGPYETREEALTIRNEFINIIKKHEQELSKIFHKESNKNKKSIEFIYDNKVYKGKMFKTIKEAIIARGDVNILLEDKKKRA